MTFAGRRGTRASTAVHISVRFFAAHRDVTGCPTLAIDVPNGASASLAFEHLCSRFPALRRAASSVAFAVNQQHVRGEQLLQDGDELALLPPVAGG